MENNAIRIEKVREYTKANGFSRIYLAAAHASFYERYVGKDIGEGVHPWKVFSGIYMMETINEH